ncbi:ABC transporter permease [Nitrosopumilus sp.]|uniref:ABC transporter permease n=1 Tax=Nitrosopumilus sp. TaxID=2024843 RepID=UPI00247CE722|nr:ABC transporter permease [Nitrosopumilus sp.]MCV0431861.1 ABC transporter permease [Nitrosopumilus sp.]
MNPTEILKLSFSALNERKVRTLLTVLMVVVGSSLMIVLNGLSAGQTQFIEDQLNQLADNVLTVTPGQRSFRSVDTTPSIVFNSAVVNKMNSLSSVIDVIPRYSGSVDLNSQSRVLRTSVLAMNPDDVYVSVPGLEMESSSVIKPNDPSAILVGQSVAYPDGSAFPIVTLGQSVKLTFTYVDDEGDQQEDSRTFVVSGILKESGDRTLDRSVIISENVGNTFLKKSGKYDSLLVVLQSAELTAQTEDDLKDLFGNSIGVSSLQSRLQFRQQFTEGNNAFIQSIGVIALVVGAVGIITTLYTSVTERIKEIGTMKAIGTQNSTILMLFLMEALLIGLLGGTVGILVGMISGHALSSVLSPPGFRNAPTVIPIFHFVDTLNVWLLSVGLSISAGILPAWKASTLSPLVALRRE